MTKSIERIREELTATLKALGPDSTVEPRIEALRQACREYLDAVAHDRQTGQRNYDFGPALVELREAFRETAEAVGTRFRLPAATALVEEMEAADRQLTELRESQALPELAAGEPVDSPPGSTTPSASADDSPEMEAARPDNPLVIALGDRDSDVRFAAMTALRDRLEPGLLPVIEPLLNDSDNYIRQYAVEYYAQLTGK